MKTTNPQFNMKPLENDMHHTRSIFLALLLTLSILPVSSRADSHGHDEHNMSGHSVGHETNQGMSTHTTHGETMGVIHTINPESRMVNLTHDPIPALGWPKMTMDLQTTKRVNLSDFKPGDRVHFTVKKGRDNQFRIVKMTPNH